MASSSGLSIPFDVGLKHKSASLEKQIEQITLQRGLFRKLNEEALEDEITQAIPLSVDQRPAEVQASGESTEDETTQAQQKLWKTRDDMIQKLSYAQNEILSALDFVSLLLSSHVPAAQSSMSPALKELVPAKTLAGRVVDHMAPSSNTRSLMRDVSEGWKSESFHDASSKLKEASLRLQEETRKQGKYWEQIAKLKSHGWPVSRLPADSRAIGVHFGSQEAATQFRQRGFTLLEQDELGNVHLDNRLTKLPITSLTVTLLRNGVETGSFTTLDQPQTSPSNVITDLLAARNALFLEELFHEISREGRSIANQGVRSQQHRIEADIGDGHQISICRTIDNTTNNSQNNPQDANIAQMVAVCLQLLLVSEHKRLHHKRAQPPLPMAPGLPNVPEYALLRPLLARLRHQAQVSAVLKICKAHIAAFHSAGINVTISQKPTVQHDAETASDETESLRHRVTSNVVVKAVEQPSLIVKVETYLAAPTYGTQFEIAPTRFDFISVHSETFHSIAELRTLIANRFMLLGVACVLRFLVSPASQSSEQISWILSKPYSGEFIAVHGNQNVAKVVLSIKPSSLMLHTIQTRTKSDHKLEKKTFRWTRSGFEALPAQSFTSSTSLSVEGVFDMFTSTLSGHV